MDKKWCLFIRGRHSFYAISRLTFVTLSFPSPVSLCPFFALFCLSLSLSLCYYPCLPLFCSVVIRVHALLQLKISEWDFEKEKKERKWKQQQEKKPVQKGLKHSSFIRTRVFWNDWKRHIYYNELIGYIHTKQTKILFTWVLFKWTKCIVYNILW